MGTTGPGATHTLFSALYAVRGHDVDALPKMTFVDESSPLKLRIRQAPPLVTRMEYGAKGLRVAANLDGF